MCDTLCSEAHRLLQNQSSETRSVRGRLSALFQTPLNAIKRGLSTATRGHSLLESKSAILESLSELLGSSRVHDTTNQADWNAELGDSTLAMVSTQGQPSVRDNNNSASDKTQSQQHDNSGHRREYTIKNNCQPPSQMSTSSRRKNQPRTRKSLNTLNKPATRGRNNKLDTTTVPDTQDDSVRASLSSSPAEKNNMNNSTILNGEKKRGRPKGNKRRSIPHKDCPAIIEHDVIPKTQPMPYCIPLCRFSGKETTQADLVRCCLCMGWFHPVCTGDNNEEALAKGAWACSQCRRLPSNVSTMLSEIRQMSSDVKAVNEMRDTLNALQKKTWIS